MSARPAWLLILTLLLLPACESRDYQLVRGAVVAAADAILRSDSIALNSLVTEDELRIKLRTAFRQEPSVIEAMTRPVRAGLAERRGDTVLVSFLIKTERDSEEIAVTAMVSNKKATIHNVVFVDHHRFVEP